MTPLANIQLDPSILYEFSTDKFSFFNLITTFRFQIYPSPEGDDSENT